MNLWVISGIALALSMDAFAVAVAASASLPRLTPRRVFRLSFHVGLFQAMMPVIGWTSGLAVSDRISRWDHWLAFGLLAFIGGKSIFSFLRKDEGVNCDDPTRGLVLVMLSVATSVDALAVGASFAMLQVKIWYPAAIIGLVAAALTLAGMLLGRRLGDRFGKQVGIAGGLVLIGIGLHILFRHLYG